MNAPLNSDSQLYSTSEAGVSTAPAGYAPSVPISVYRELATELKTTQITLDALTKQNQQLLRQNKLLRNEIQRFVQAAEQLGHFAGVAIPEPPITHPDTATSGWQQEPPSDSDIFVSQSVPPEASQRSPLAQISEPKAPSRPPQSRPSAKEEMPKAAERLTPPQNTRTPERTATSQNTAIVPHPKVKSRDRTLPDQSDLNKHRLFTEQRESMRPLSKVASRSDLGNLWLATTILIVIFSAFGAGFLIMRPLLSR